MYPAPYAPVATFNPGAPDAWASAGGAVIGTMLLQTMANNLVGPMTAHRDLVVAAAAAVGTVGGSLLAAPVGQKVGASVGGLAGLLASYGVAKIDALPWWVKVPVAILTVPAGAYVGARVAAR